ncbi:MAG TPA: SusC/RagA family TonB-linked outer membrane protein [Longimicrobiales bacterium]
MRRSSGRIGAVGVVLALAAIAARAAPLAAQGATGAVTGEVIEATTQRPLAGAQVHIPGTPFGALTNAGGRYLIPGVPAGPVVVRVQMIGYGTVEREVTIQAGQTAQADFELRQSAITLDELVVTGAGVATERRKLGNTVAAIDASRVETAPIANVSEILQGREPGVVANLTGGGAGEGSNIRIRGGASISQSNDPILIIDGVRVDNGGGMGGLEPGGGSPSRLDDIDPATIERIEILKGAAAATLYGTEASNGVIQIFTKSGVAGRPTWRLNVEQGISLYPAERYAPHAGFARTQEQADRLSAFWGQTIRPYEVFEVDLWPSLFETGRFSSYSLSVSGGGEEMTYFLSGRYLSENGPFQNDGFGPAVNGLEYIEDVNEKKQVTANVTFYPSETLRIRANSMYVDGYIEVPENNNSIYGTISNLINSKPERANEANPSGSVPTFGSMREMMYRHASQGIQRFSGSVGADYTPLESVSMELTFGVDLVNEQNVAFVPFGWNVDGLTAASPEGTRDVRDRNHRMFTADTKVSWTEEVTDRIGSTFVVGAQAYYQGNTLSGGSGTKFPGPGLEVIEAAEQQSVFEERIVQLSAGVFAQEQVGFDDYLFVTLGARYDKHSAFGESASGALYPKLSASFIPSDMDGWEALGPLSSLRLRAAIGQSGLQPGAFDKLTTFEPLNSANGSGVEPSNLGNQDLKPEVSTEIEVGADLGLFQDRFSLTATYWDRVTRDALIARRYAPSGGFPNPQLDNIGEIRSHGVELGLRGFVVNSPDFSVDLFVNAAYLSQRVADLGGAPPIKLGYYRYGNWIMEGYAPGAFFGPKLVDSPYPIDQNGDGQPDSAEELAAYFSAPRDPGEIRVLLADDDGDGDFLDHYLGKPTPDWTGAFGGTITFLRNFSINTLFEWKAGNFQVHNLTHEFRRSHAAIGRNIRESAELEAILLNPASTAEERVEAARRWATEMAGLTPQDRLNAIEDADFLRWRELSIRYRFPASAIERFGMNSLELTLGGRNLALFTKYGGVDPEVNVIAGRGPGATEENNFLLGVEGWNFAIPRRFTLSATVGF